MNEGMKARLERQLAEPLSGLVGLTRSDFHSLLLTVLRERAALLSPSVIRQNYQRNRFVRPSRVCQRQLTRLQWLAWDAIPGQFQALELSPLAPFGCCSGVAPVGQDRIVGADRELEVLADPTNLLAFECAQRRQKDRKNPVHLATSARCVRAQPLQSEHHTAHFRVLALTSAGRLKKAFRTSALVVHLSALAAVVDTARLHGCQLGPPRVRLSDWEGDLFDQVRDRLEVEVLPHHHRTRARGYYRSAAFLLEADWNGEPYELGDGGFVDWTAKLLSDRKEELLISGLGLELLAYTFA